MKKSACLNDYLWIGLSLFKNAKILITSHLDKHGVETLPLRSPFDEDFFKNLPNNNERWWNSHLACGRSSPTMILILLGHALRYAGNAFVTCYQLSDHEETSEQSATRSQWHVNITWTKKMCACVLWGLPCSPKTTSCSPLTRATKLLAPVLWSHYFFNWCRIFVVFTLETELLCKYRCITKHVCEQSSTVNVTVAKKQRRWCRRLIIIHNTMINDLLIYVSNCKLPGNVRRAELDY